MGVLQKAYTFVKKHWSTDDDVFPDDLNRYEDGIDDLYSVTNQTNTNIGNLSNLLSQAKSNIVTAINEIVTNLQSEIETRGNTDTELESKINDLSQETLLALPSKKTNKFASFDGSGIAHGAKSGTYSGIISMEHDGNGMMLGVGTYSSSYDGAMDDVIVARKSDGVWQNVKRLATTTKTDILFPYNSGYTTQATHIRNGIVVENNHIYVYINVRKLDGSDVAAGSTIGILPPNCRPDKEIWGTIYLRDYTACYVIITPDGKVIIGGTTDSQYFIGCIDYYI